MANKKCPACGAPVSPGEDFCSFCGAVLPRNEAARTAAAVQTAPAEKSGRRVQTPRTIEELLAFCERHELPLAKMRFFIGLDYPGAKAYGIYQEKNGDFVVYKNKADGSRAVRYRGPDEAHAVSEIFEKLKSEATGQRARVAAAREGYSASERAARASGASGAAVGRDRLGRRRPNKLLIGLIAAAAAVTIVRTAVALRPQANQPSTGYYHYNDHYYYHQNDDWYYYDSGFGSWYPLYSVDDELSDNLGDYYSSYSYDDDYGVESFADSDYYDSGSSYSSDWDSGSSDSWSWDWDDDDDWDSSSDWDWDSDWDSDWGDWDSDW